MKLIKLEFENINSLKGLQVIDFTKPPLSNSGLFLIAGPTGSGKSTILDAITLALFNKIPRFSASISVNQIQKMGSVVTHFESQAMASITYESNGVQYNSSWSLSKNKNDNWRDYHMEIYKVSDGSIFDLKKSEVPEQNEKLIGLKYEQFLKSILLSQGEFAQFLKADHNERGALLEKLTGTEIYRRVGELTYERWKNEKDAIESDLKEIGTIPIMEPDLVHAKRLEQETIQKEVTHAEKTIKKGQDAMHVKSQLVEIAQQVAKLTQHSQQHQTSIEDFKPYEIKLEMHNAFSPLTSDLALYKNKSQELEKAKVDQSKTTLALQSAKESLKTTLESMSSLVKKEVSLVNFTAEMKALEQTYIALSTQSASLVSDGKALRAKIREKIVNNGELTDKMPPSEALSVISEKERKFLENKGKLNANKPLDEELEAYLERSNVLRDQLVVVEDFTSLNDNAVKNNKLIRELQEQLSKLNIEIKELDTAINIKKVEIEKKQEELSIHNKKFSLSDLRAALKEEEECPLCGSTTHPYKMHDIVFEEGKLSVELRMLKLELEDHEKQFFTKTKSATSIQTQVAEKEIAQKNDTSKIAVLVNKAQVLNFSIEGTDIAALKAESVKCTENIARIKQLIQQEKIVTSYNNLKGDYSELASIHEKYKKIKLQLTELYEGDNLIDTTNHLQDQFNLSNTNINTYTETLHRLNKQIEEVTGFVKEKEEGLLTKLEKIAIKSIGEAEQLILSSEEYEILKAKKEKLTQLTVEIESNLQQLRTAQLEWKDKDTNTQSFVELKDQLLALSRKKDEWQQSIGSIQQQLKVNEESVMLKKGRLKEIETRKSNFEKWSTLNSLIGDKTGNKFANFAQDLTLKTLISIANKHLSTLSDRYLMKNTDITEDLAVYDTYQGDTERSIATLSGGETFIVSLAMAVSLSELASRNVMIQSIFIDEGFGSLDAESLEQAMNTLEMLQSNSNKTIGIISHVDSLKERLTTQIQLSKDNKGYSTINIIG